MAGTGWYRRKANFEHSGRLFICFGAVDYRADVYINGVHAGAHQGGYSYFELEITDLWHAGENTVVKCAPRTTAVRPSSMASRAMATYRASGRRCGWGRERPQQYIRDWRVTTRIDGTVNLTVMAEAADGSEGERML